MRCCALRRDSCHNEMRRPRCFMTHMHRDRIEEALMLVVACGMLTFLLHADITRDLSTLVMLALVMVLLLIVRGVSWHEERITPYDGILIIGIFLTALYLFSFMPVQRVPFTAPTIIVVALYYLIMAILLAMHRGRLFVPATPWRGDVRDDAHDDYTSRGFIDGSARSKDDSRSAHPTRKIQLMATPAKRSEVSPSNAGSRSPRSHTSAPHRHKLLQRWRRNTSAYPVSGASSVKRPSLMRRIFTRRHDASFYRGIEPIPQMTPGDSKRHASHRTQPSIDRQSQGLSSPPVEIYHESPQSDLFVALPGSNVFHDERCDRLRSTRPGMRFFINKRSAMLKKMIPCPRCKPVRP